MGGDHEAERSGLRGYERRFSRGNAIAEICREEGENLMRRLTGHVYVIFFDLLLASTTVYPAYPSQWTQLLGHRKIEATKICSAYTFREIIYIPTLYPFGSDFPAH